MPVSVYPDTVHTSTVSGLANTSFPLGRVLLGETSAQRGKDRFAYREPYGAKNLLSSP
jgi:hypothetical protein